MSYTSHHSELLRPAFTRRLAEGLISGKCIELIGPHGQGRRRTLQDLQQLIPTFILTFHLDMKLYSNDFIGFINALNIQAGIQKDSLGSLIKVLADGNQAMLLILHNFDLLYADTGVDPHFDAAFFDQLNAIASAPHLALLCVSEQSHTGMPLRAEPLLLPPLTQAEATAELARQLPRVGAESLSMLATEAATHPAPYTRLQQLIREVAV